MSSHLPHNSLLSLSLNYYSPLSLKLQISRTPKLTTFTKRERRKAKKIEAFLSLLQFRRRSKNLLFIFFYIKQSVGSVFIPGLAIPIKLSASTKAHSIQSNPNPLLKHLYFFRESLPFSLSLSISLSISLSLGFSPPVLMEASPNDRLHFGKMGFGCPHYRRRCQIRAPCCNEIFDCRHCHNESTSTLRNIYDRHDLVRQDVKQVICSVCDTEQPVAQVCSNCGVNMGEYFCNICKFYDDDTDKQQFHCDDCGICRVGGRENFFHCKKCGSCYAIGLRNNHRCVENSMRHHCPICYEYLFDSLKDTNVMKCGHTMHLECYNEMIKRDKFCCPICSRSVIDMSKTWQRLDEEIEATAMPSDYRDKKVWILCNDCNDTTEVYFHIIGQKCGHCRSYNTRAIAPPVLPQ